MFPLNLEEPVSEDNEVLEVVRYKSNVKEVDLLLSFSCLSKIEGFEGFELEGMCEGWCQPQEW